jgi:hypothetical protein
MARLLCSAHALPEVIYRDELDSCRDGAQVSYTLTRRQPLGRTGFSCRIGAALLKEIAWPAEENPLASSAGRRASSKPPRQRWSVSATRRNG